MDMFRSAYLSRPGYFAVAALLLTFLILSWRIPSGRTSSPTRYSHLVTSAVVAGTLAVLLWYANPSASAEIFDTNPPGF
jgi:hypothetical protein